MGQLGDAVVQYPVNSVASSHSLGGTPQPTVMRVHEVVNSASFTQVPHPGGAMTGSIVLVPSNPNRIGLKIYNSGTTGLHMGFGRQVSWTGSFDMRLLGDSLYEHPVPVYTGPVWGSWASGSLSGNLAFITETSLS